MGNYWQAQTEGFNRGAGNLGSALIQIPRIQMMQRYRDSMAATAAAREQAYADEARAHADVYRGQKAGMDADQLGDSKLADALTRYAKNPQDTDAQADVIAGIGRAYKKNPEGTAKGLGAMFAQFAARNGSTNQTQMGDLQGGAASIANNQNTVAAKAAAPVVMPNGSTMVDPKLGNVLAQAAATLGPGAARVAPVMGDDPASIEANNPKAAADEMATVKQTIPAKKGTPAIPAQPASGHLWWAKPAVDAQPGTPDQPATTITKKVALADALASAAPAAAVAAPVAAAQPFDAAVQPAPAAAAPAAAPASPQKPTRAQAATLVQQLGRDGAMQRLKAAGYDLSGYAD